MMHLAYCGFDCRQCPVYSATETNDRELRERLSKRYSTPENPLSAEDLYCGGCRSDSASCNNMCASCAIRVCAKKRNAETCAVCDSYPCAVIERSMPQGTAGRSHLDKLYNCGNAL